MSGKKKVVHLTTVHHPLDPRIFYKQCCSLKQNGYDVTLIAPASNDIKGDEEVEINTFPKRSSRVMGLIFGTAAAYRKARKIPADVYHFHDPELIPAAWLLKRKNNRVIYDIHEDYETGIVQRDYLTLPLRKLLAKIYKLTEKMLTGNMEFCLAEKYYKEKYPRGKCILNYPLLDEALIANEPKRKTGDSRLLYTGNLTEDRGALIHAELPQTHKGVSVHCYGRCPEALAAEMERIAGSAKERLNITGVNRYLPKEEIDKAYTEQSWLAGLALFPPTEHYKKKELTKFFEYMTAGIPILCSDFPEWKAFIEKYQCGLAVNPRDAAQIRDAIDYLKYNPAEAMKMGERGRKAVIDSLNWGREEEKLINWYENLMSTGEESK